jgi:phosphoglycolate phosphatase
VTKVLYTDLDGTMVGPWGCFFRADDGGLTLEPARALIDLLAAGVEIVLVSGRTRPQLVEAAALVGADGFVGELGAVLGWDRGRQTEVLRGAMPAAFEGTPAEVMQDGGLPESLFARWPGRLEWHEPWHLGHDADLMLRGNVDVAEVETWLAERGWDWLRLHDNGVLPRRTLPGGDPVHVYHLMPAGLDKGTGVARDLARRGLTADDAVAVGDSLSDLAMAEHVRTCYLVANGALAPATRARAAALGNVRVLSGSVGLGWAEAVRDVLSRG